MTKLALLLFFLSTSTLCLIAQQPAPEPEGPATVVGCVLGINGGYSLNTAAGKSYILDGSNLQQFSGQQVRVLGKVTYSKKPGTNSKAENMVIRGDQPTLAVTRIDKLSDTCKH